MGAFNDSTHQRGHFGRGYYDGPLQRHLCAGGQRRQPQRTRDGHGEEQPLQPVHHGGTGQDRRWGQHHSVGADGTANADAGDYAQAFFKVVESGDKGTFDPNADNDDEIELEYRQFGGPTWCASDETRDYDPTPDDSRLTDDESTPVGVETQATSAVYGPVALPGKGLPLAADPPAVQQEIATIFAKHGDRLTVTTSAGSGQVQLVVDGDGPDFSAVTPADNAVTRPSRLTFSFEVRDDDSGLRHDGEAVISPDNDLQEINPDGDAALGSEPLSINPKTAVPANGASADIDVNVATNLRNELRTRRPLRGLR